MITISTFNQNQTVKLKLKASTLSKPLCFIDHVKKN